MSDAVGDDTVGYRGGGSKFRGGHSTFWRSVEPLKEPKCADQLSGKDSMFKPEVTENILPALLDIINNEIIFEVYAMMASVFLIKLVW